MPAAEGDERVKGAIQRFVATALIAGCLMLAAPVALAEESSAGGGWDPWCRDPSVGWRFNLNPPYVAVWGDPGELCPIT